MAYFHEGSFSFGDVAVVGGDATTALTISGGRVYTGQALAGSVGLDLGPVIAFPGLVNSHDHLEFNCYPALGNPPYEQDSEWFRDVQENFAEVIGDIEALPLPDRIAWGIAKNLISGVTAVLHHGPYHEAVFEGCPLDVVRGFHFIHSVHGQDGWRRELLKFWKGRPVVAHVGEGVSEEARREAARFFAANRLNRDIVAVHGVCLGPEQARGLKALIWCPQSNLHLFGQTANVAALAAETEILFGTDSSISARGSLWDHLRRVRGDGLLPDGQLFAALTSAPRKVWDLGGSGRLEDGAALDFVLARRHHEDPWVSFFGLRPADILLVVRGGRILLADADAVADNPALEGGLGDHGRLRLAACDKYLPAGLVAAISRLGAQSPRAAAVINDFLGTAGQMGG